MMQLIVNGTTMTPNMPETASFSELVDYIHANLANETNLISSMKVNGVEISETEEKELSAISIDAIDSVEIILKSPREIADETLQTLSTFLGRLPALCELVADRIEAETEGEELFQRLLDHLEIFSETLRTVKGILRIGFLQDVSVLEAEFSSVLQDLVEAHQNKDRLYRAQLLREHLPANLKDWVQTGIPTLIRARDS